MKWLCCSKFVFANESVLKHLVQAAVCDCFIKIVTHAFRERVIRNRFCVVEPSPILHPYVRKILDVAEEIAPDQIDRFRDWLATTHFSNV